MVNKIASVILTFNRPNYFKRTLNSLEKNIEIEDIDWFILQDGKQNKISKEVYSEVKPHEKVLELAHNSILPNKHIITQEFNISPAQQRYKALELLNDYELLFCFDDDMVVSRYYIKLLKQMANQFPNYIGLLYSNKKRSSKMDILRVVNNPRLWGHYITQESYFKIKDKYKKYYEFMKTFDYHQRRSSGVDMSNTSFIMDDIVITRLCRQKGIKKLEPDVSRGLYIGKFGMVAYKTENYWNKKKMNKQSKDIEFESDRNLERFILK